METSTALPARYFPFAHGRYEIAPGLTRFGKDFGNGPVDRQVFQIDRDFPRFRAVKLAARSERLQRYLCEAGLTDDVRAAVASFITDRLLMEHPRDFQCLTGFAGRGLDCALTGESFSFDGSGRLVRAVADVQPGYRDALDALGNQIQEDFAIISSDQAGRHWISYLHLCAPNHWAAEEKIGRDFASVHAPVAGMGSINRHADVHVKTMLQAGEGLVRFAWGMATDPELNHHPLRNEATAARRFDPAQPKAWVRVERQTMWGFPPMGAALFTIRTYFLDCHELMRSDSSMRGALVAAIESMPPESIRYKGLQAWCEPLLAWLGTVES